MIRKFIYIIVILLTIWFNNSIKQNIMPETIKFELKYDKNNNLIKTVSYNLLEIYGINNLDSKLINKRIKVLNSKLVRKINNTIIIKILDKSILYKKDYQSFCADINPFDDKISCQDFKYMNKKDMLKISNNIRKELNINRNRNNYKLFLYSLNFYTYFLKENLFIEKLITDNYQLKLIKDNLYLNNFFNNKIQNNFKELKVFDNNKLFGDIFIKYNKLMFQKTLIINNIGLGSNNISISKLYEINLIDFNQFLDDKIENWSARYRNYIKYYIFNNLKLD